MSKIVKGIGRALKSVGKAIKKVAKSTVGKALLVGAAIWLGGGAFGLWKTPFQSINGIFTSGAGSGAATAGANAAGAAGTSLTTPGGIAMNTAYTAPSVASAAAPTVGNTVLQGVNTAVNGTTAGGGGIINGLKSGVKAAASFVEKNPVASAIALNTAAGAFTPDDIDIMREQQRLESEQAESLYQQRLQNLKVGGIDIGVKPSTINMRGTERQIGDGGIINTFRRS